MSNPLLHELNLLVEINPDGVPVAAVRECRNCGGRGKRTYYLLPQASRRTDLADVIDEHLEHCDKAHDIRPVLMCGYKVHVVVDLKVGQSEVRHPMVCTKEKHDEEEEHNFVLKATTHPNPRKRASSELDS